MTAETPGDGYTLGLMVDLRELCKKIGESHHRMAAELHDLLRRVANPDVHGLDKDLTFRSSRPPPTASTARLCGPSPSTATPRSPGQLFRAAVRCYPDQKWLLLWRAYIVEKYEPEG
jgi:hypothetical protein